MQIEYVERKSIGYKVIIDLGSSIHVCIDHVIFEQDAIDLKELIEGIPSLKESLTGVTRNLDFTGSYLVEYSSFIDAFDKISKLIPPHAAFLYCIFYMNTLIDMKTEETTAGQYVDFKFMDVSDYPEEESDSLISQYARNEDEAYTSIMKVSTSTIQVNIDNTNFMSVLYIYAKLARVLGNEQAIDIITSMGSKLDAQSKMFSIVNANIVNYIGDLSRTKTTAALSLMKVVEGNAEKYPTYSEKKGFIHITIAKAIGLVSDESIAHAEGVSVVNNIDSVISSIEGIIYKEFGDIKITHEQFEECKYIAESNNLHFKTLVSYAKISIAEGNSNVPLMLSLSLDNII